MSYTKISSCPRCGSPIWCQEQKTSNDLPIIQHSCRCFGSQNLVFQNKEKEEIEALVTAVKELSDRVSNLEELLKKKSTPLDLKQILKG